MQSYFILLHNFNTKGVEKYDIMPYLISTYNKCKEKKHWWPMDDPTIEPISKSDFNHFVKHACMHRYWSRCEYEWLMLGWPPGNTDSLESCQKLINSSIKIDAWEQIEMNLDIVVTTFMANIKCL